MAEILILFGLGKECRDSCYSYR